LIEKIPATSGRGRTRAVTKTIMFTLFISLAFLSGWTLVKYFHYAPLQGYLVEGTRFSLSTFQIEIALAGSTGLLASLLIQSRRRSRKTQVNTLKMTPLTFGTMKPVHPLMMTQRPARDTKFVIRKTRKPGRIYRNRMGERLPPTFTHETDNSPS